MDYRDCNGYDYYKKNSLKIGSGESQGLIESMDYIFTAEQLLKSFYDVTLGTSEILGSGRK